MGHREAQKFWDLLTLTALRSPHLFQVHFLLTRLESSYSLLTEAYRTFGKDSGCFIIIKWPIS